MGTNKTTNTWIYITLASLMLGCAIARTEKETVFVLGQTRYESCVGDGEQKECTAVESKGLSAEFVAFCSLAFGWIPWPF